MTHALKLLLASTFLWGVGEGLFIVLYPLHVSEFLLATGNRVWLGLAYFCHGSWSLARNMTIAQVGAAVEKAKEMGMAYGAVETVMALVLILGQLLAGHFYAWRPSLPFQVSLGLLAVTCLLKARFAPQRGPAA